MSQLASKEVWNPVREYLFPIESRNVRQCMIEAADWSKSQDFFLSRISSVSLTAIAVIMSAINTPIYLLSAPVKLVLNAVHLNPLKMVTDVAWDLINAVRSFVFVALGVSLIAIGLIIPEQTFVCFSPLFSGTPTEKIKIERDELVARLKLHAQKNVALEATVKQKEKEVTDLDKEVGDCQEKILQLQETIGQRDNPLLDVIQQKDAQIRQLNDQNTQLRQRQLVFRPFGYNLIA